MHDVGISLDAVQLFDLHCAELADLAQVVAPQIDEHIVLGQLFLVGQQVGLQRGVLGVGLAARPRARQREGVQHTFFEFHQCFGRRARDLDVGAGKVEHIGRRVDGAQHTVRAQQTAVKRRRQPVREHDLEDVALVNAAARPLDHRAVSGLVEQRRDLAQQMPRCLAALLTVAEQVGHAFELQRGLVVVRLHLVQRHIGDQDDLLPQVVKGDDLVKQHQIYIFEILGVLRLGAGFRLAVTEVIVGEVADQTSCKRRQTGQARAFVPGEDVPQDAGRVVGLQGHIPGAQSTVDARYLHLGVVAQKGVAPPLFVGLGGFQQVAVRRNIFKHLHRLDRCADIREDLAADGRDLVRPRGRNSLDFLDRR